MDTSKTEGIIHFIWNIHIKCNYRCPYCWFNGKWQELAKLNHYLSIEELKKSWKNIYKRYGAVQINITGGEPFFYPDFVALIKELSSLHIISISTNLSVDIEKFAKEINPSKVSLLPTFHPLFVKFDDFIKKMLFLRENGFDSSKIFYVAYPPQLKQASYYRDKFENEGFLLEPITFWGEYNIAHHPERYTEEERRIIMPYLAEKTGEKFQLILRKIENKKLCHAGNRYVVIDPSGNVSRCGSSSSKFIGNLFDGNFKLLDQPLTCDSEYCPYIEYNEQSFLIMGEKEGDIKSLSRASMPPYRVFFTWYINNECNYRCSYCTPEDVKTINIKIERWFVIWDKIFDRYGCCQIDISGGEPFIYPSFIKLIKHLSQKHTLQFSTNLSWDIKPFIENINPHRIKLGASLHPEFVNLEKFLEKLILLKNNGFNVWVNYVGYPLSLRDMAERKRKVEEAGISFNILPFNGKFDHRVYPQGYTEEEKRLLMIFDDVVNKDTIEWKTEKGRNNTKSKLCRMGQMYARIYPNAEVYRCCGSNVLRLGNLVDGTFSLLDEPAPCESDNCPCWKCMLVGKEAYWQNFWTPL